MKILQSGLILLLALALPVVALAHEAHEETESEGATAVFQIDPENDPVIAQGASVTVLVRLGGEPLHFEECVCSLRLMSGRRSLGDVPLESPDNPGVWTGRAAVTFPARGTYTLVVNGSPTEPGHFVPFTLRSVRRVTRTSADQPARPHDPSAWTHWFHFLLPGFAAAFLIIALTLQALRHRRSATA